jgi:hypothetical protein
MYRANDDAFKHIHRRFLRGKIVDKAKYDLWKDQSQNANVCDGEEMDAQISRMSFSFEDDDDKISYDEKMTMDVNARDKNEKDNALLIIKVPPI